MAELHLPRPRHAAPVGTFVPVAGFLPPIAAGDLDSSRRGERRPATARTLDHWHDARVVVLLGEAGIGKSRALATWADSREAAGASTCRINLALQSPSGLAARWFAHPDVEQWRSASGVLELFLDGLDEFPGELRRLAAEIQAFVESSQDHLARLRIRTAGRAHAWTSGLSRVLSGIAGDGGATVLSLLPLEREDVALAAAERSWDAGALLDWVDRHRAEPLASRPLTLRMLLDVEKGFGALPTSRASLFEHHLVAVFRGHGEDARDKRTLTEHQRMALAGRIAAATTFSRRPFVASGSVEAPEDITTRLEDLVGPWEGSEEGPSRVQATLAALRETVAVGPFTPFGDVVVWSSRAYEEFLAARHLATYRPDTATLDALLVHPHDPERRTVATLRGTVGWIADLYPDAWSWLASKDPRALIDADPGSRSDQDRERLVEAWLCGLERGEFADDLLELDDRLGNLVHRGIGRQIIRWLDPTAHRPVAVRSAARLAGATGAVECVSALAPIVREPWSADANRMAAVHALRALREMVDDDLLNDDGTREVVALCKDVLAFGRNLDPDDNLLGLALRVLWPDHLSSEALFEHLRSPHHRMHFGAYQGFLFEMARAIEPGILPRALRWAAGKSRLGSGGVDRFPMASQVLEALAERARALGLLDQPAILKEILRAHLDSYVSFSPSAELVDELRLRARTPAFVRALFAMAGPEGGPSTLAYRVPERLGVVAAELVDPAWTLLDTATDPRERTWLADALIRWSPRGDAASVERLLHGAAKHPELREVGVELGKLGESPDQIVAEIARRDAELATRWAQPEREPPKLDPPLAVRLRSALAAAHDGESDKWWSLLHHLHRAPPDRGWDVDWHVSPDKSFGWGTLDGDEQSRVVDAARSFLLRDTPRTEAWLGRQNHREVAHAFMGLGAMRLLWSSGKLGELHDDKLATWAPAVVDHGSMFREHKEHSELLEFLVDRVPEAVARTWVAMLRGESGHLPLVAFERRWGPAVERVLTEALVETSDPKQAEILLPGLLGRGVATARAWAQARLPPLAGQPDSPDFQMAVVSAFALLRGSAEDAARVLEFVDEHPGAAGAVLERLGAHTHVYEPNLSASWSDAVVVGRFAELLARHYPPREDPRRDGSHWFGPEDALRNERDRCLDTLVELARTLGWRAVDELARLERMFPDWHAVPWKRMVGTERASHGTWRPPGPSEVLKVIREGVRTVPEGGVKELERLLLDLYSDAQMRRLVRDLPGPRLDDQLPGGIATPAAVASHLVSLVVRERQVEPLLQVMRRTTPGRLDDIDRVAVQCVPR